MMVPFKQVIAPLLILLIAAPRNGFSQPGILWENSFGGTYTDQGVAVLETQDGGFLALCMPYSLDGDVSGSNGKSEFWLLKLDNAGQLVWKKTYGGSNEETPRKIIPAAAGGGYFLLGWSDSADGDITFNHGKNDVWLVKIDDNGDLVWQKTFGGTDNDYGYAITASSDGNYIIAGSSYSSDGDVPNSNDGNQDVWIFKIDPDGQILWSRLYGGSAPDFAKSILPLSDGSFFVAGSSSSNDGDALNNHGLGDVFVLKINNNGDILLSKLLGGEGLDYNEDMVSSGDGGAVLINTSNSTFPTNHGDYDVWGIKLNEAGAVQWQKCFGGSGVDSGTGIFRMSNGNFILTGIPWSYDDDVSGNFPGQNAWLFCIDPNGSMLWHKTYGGSNSDVFRSGRELTDGEFIVVGHTSSSDGDAMSGTGPSNSGDVWVLRMSLNPSDSKDVQTETVMLQIVPNPATDVVSIVDDAQWDHAVLTLTGIDGLRVLQQNLTADRRADVSTLPAGMYIAALDYGKGIRFAKMIKE